MRAFVIGNVALDDTISVAALPAPGASIHGRLASQDLGGKGANQAIVLARAGIACRLGAAVGSDTRADEIRARLRHEPLDIMLEPIAAVASDLSVILTDADGENTIITTNAAAQALTPDRALAMMAEAVSGDLLVVQGNLSGPATLALLRAARARGVRSALNPSPMPEYAQAALSLADIVFVNEGEAADLGGADALLAAGVGQVVLTLGARGARLLTAGQQIEVPALTCPAVDPTGAGDCFMATALASALRRGTALDARALRHAAAAAALTVQRWGTVAAFPTCDELAAILATP